MRRRTAIIGAGFAGTLTTVHMIRNSNGDDEILLINRDQDTFGKGLAYKPYSKAHLLNVITAKMSAFAGEPDHFLDWVMNKNEFKGKDRVLVANSFLPRYLYGEYLGDIWSSARALAKSKNVVLQEINDVVKDISTEKDIVKLELEKSGFITVERCVIANGNNIPRNPAISEPAFYNSARYFRNPWQQDAVRSADPALPILILGNGLTMVDTVLGLLEQGFHNDIYSLSPNGFNILPHRHNGLKYTKLTDEIKPGMSLLELVRIINKHIKLVREFGVSPEPVLDSIRSHTQEIWKGLSQKDKSVFMGRLRHLWGVARHRIPLHIHDKIQQLRMEGKLHIIAGKLINISEKGDNIEVLIYDKRNRQERTIVVSRVINCTGPETDLQKLQDHFLYRSLSRGTITQDELKLGITADTATFQVMDSEGKKQKNLYTLGSNLKGELWESTAVNELRTQAELLAALLKERK
jgi:uncharacterized NAD(P)/FAD-binding protein YdhS